MLHGHGRAGPGRAPHDLRHVGSGGPARGRGVRQGLARGARHRSRPSASSTGCPSCWRASGREDGPQVLFHGHLDVVPAREGQFSPRVDGDRLIGRGAYDMKGALAALMLALADVKDQSAVGVRLVCVPDEESDDVTRRSTDALVREGLRGGLRAHRRADGPPHRRPGQGRPGRAPARGRHRGPRLDAVARRQRDPQGPRRLSPDRDAALQPRVLGPVRPAVDQPRAHRRRGRLQQGPRHLHDRRRHPLPARPAPRRDPRPDPPDRRPRGRQDVHPRAGDRRARQPVRAGAARRGRAARRRATR